MEGAGAQAAGGGAAAGDTRPPLKPALRKQKKQSTKQSAERARWEEEQRELLREQVIAPAAMLRSLRPAAPRLVRPDAADFVCARARARAPWLLVSAPVRRRSRRASSASKRCSTCARRSSCQAEWKSKCWRRRQSTCRRMTTAGSSRSAHCVASAGTPCARARCPGSMATWGPFASCCMRRRRRKGACLPRGASTTARTGVSSLARVCV